MELLAPGFALALAVVAIQAVNKQMEDNSLSQINKSLKRIKRAQSSNSISG